MRSLIYPMKIQIKVRVLPQSKKALAIYSIYPFGPFVNKSYTS